MMSALQVQTTLSWLVEVWSRIQSRASDLRENHPSSFLKMQNIFTGPIYNGYVSAAGQRWVSGIPFLRSMLDESDIGVV